MSATGEVKALTPPDIVSHKGGTPLVCLTAYTTPMARLVDTTCDIVLVVDLHFKLGLGQFLEKRYTSIETFAA